MFRGFDVQEVDTFLEDLAEDYEALLKENTLLKEQLQALEERTRGLEEREQRAAGDARHHPAAHRGDEGRGAARGGRSSCAEAELQGEKIIEAARTAEGAIQARDQPRSSARGGSSPRGSAPPLEMYQRLLDQDLKDGRRTPEGTRLDQRLTGALLRVACSPRRAPRARCDGLAGRGAPRAA